MPDSPARGRRPNPANRENRNAWHWRNMRRATARSTSSASQRPRAKSRGLLARGILVTDVASPVIVALFHVVRKQLLQVRGQVGVVQHTALRANVLERGPIDDVAQPLEMGPVEDNPEVLGAHRVLQDLRPSGNAFGLTPEERNASKSAFLPLAWQWTACTCVFCGIYYGSYAILKTKQ